MVRSYRTLFKKNEWKMSNTGHFKKHFVYLTSTILPRKHDIRIVYMTRQGQVTDKSVVSGGSFTYAQLQGPSSQRH